MILNAIILVVLLGASAFMSMSETALFNLTRYELHELERSRHPFGRMVAHLMRRPGQVLSTVLIANTAVNVLFFAASYLLVASMAHPSKLADSLSGILSVLLVLIFGEVAPKSVALVNARLLAPLVAPIIRVISWILAPVRIVLTYGLVVPIVRLILPSDRRDEGITAEELNLLLQQGAKHGLIPSEESNILQEVVALSDTKARSVMVPRVDIVAVDVQAPAEEIARSFRESQFSRLPVYEGDVDHLLGFLAARDFFLSPGKPIRDLLQPIHYVPAQITLARLLEHFRGMQTQTAVVVDEYGGVAGLVSIKDVLREILGELVDTEGEPGAPRVERIDETTFRVSGLLDIRSWTETFGIRFVGDRIDTLGGLVLAELGRLPKEGEVVRIRNVLLEVESMKGRRVDMVRVRLLPTKTQGK